MKEILFYCDEDKKPLPDKLVMLENDGRSGIVNNIREDEFIVNENLFPRVLHFCNLECMSNYFKKWEPKVKAE